MKKETIEALQRNCWEIDDNTKIGLGYEVETNYKYLRISGGMNRFNIEITKHFLTALQAEEAAKELRDASRLVLMANKHLFDCDCETSSTVILTKKDYSDDGDLHYIACGSCGTKIDEL